MLGTLCLSLSTTPPLTSHSSPVARWWLNSNSVFLQSRSQATINWKKYHAQCTILRIQSVSSKIYWISLPKDQTNSILKYRCLFGTKSTKERSRPSSRPNTLKLSSKLWSKTLGTTKTNYWRRRENLKKYWWRWTKSEKRIKERYLSSRPKSTRNREKLNSNKQTYIRATNNWRTCGRSRPSELSQISASSKIPWITSSMMIGRYSWKV